MQERREIVLLSWHHHPNLSDVVKTTFLVLFTKPTLQILPACAKATAQPWSNFCPVKGALGRCFSAPRSWIWGVWGAGGMEDEAGSPFRFCWGVVTVKTSAGVTSRAFSEVRQILKSLGFSHNWQGIFFCRIQIPSCLGAGIWMGIASCPASSKAVFHHFHLEMEVPSGLTWPEPTVFIMCLKKNVRLQIAETSAPAVPSRCCSNPHCPWWPETS